VRVVPSHSHSQFFLVSSWGPGDPIPIRPSQPARRLPGSGAEATCCFAFFFSPPTPLPPPG
jgi:hypothetical protein